MIGFYREKGNPATLFESYKFSINPDTKGLTISNQAGRTSYKSKDAQTLRGEVENLLVQFNDIDNELRALPSDSYITMRLIYHSKAPKGKHTETYGKSKHIQSTKRMDLSMTTRPI